MENMSVQERIESLERLRLELMDKYYNLIRPYGLGYSIPDDINVMANDILDHAERIRAKIIALRVKHKIPLQVNLPEPNAHRVYEYKELVEIIGKKAVLPQLPQILFEGAISLLKVVDRENIQSLLQSDDFWIWYNGRMYKILKHYADAEMEPSFLKVNVLESIMIELESLEILTAYNYFKDKTAEL